MPSKNAHVNQETSSPSRRAHRVDLDALLSEEQYPLAGAARAANTPLAASATDLLSLQHVAGNQAVNRLLQRVRPAEDGRVKHDPPSLSSQTSVVQRLDQSLPYVGPLLSYLNPVNQAMRAVMPGLSRAQKSLLDGIFGASLSTSLIRLNRNSVLSTGNCYRTTGNIINMPGETIADHHLIHEAAHTWQSQNTLFGVGYAVSALRAQAIAQVLGGDWQRAYDYANLERNRVPWRYWNAEQQAHWIEDNRRLPSGWLLQGQLPNFGVESAGIE